MLNDFPIDNRSAMPDPISQFWRSLFDKKPVAQKKLVEQSSAQSEASASDTPLETFKLGCAKRATILAKQSRLKKEMAKDHFAQARALDEQIDCLMELAKLNIGDSEPSERERLELLLKLSELRQERQNWIKEGMLCQESARQVGQIANSYSKLVIELQMHIYRKRNPQSDIADRLLLLTFQEHCRVLENSLKELQPFPEAGVLPRMN